MPATRLPDLRKMPDRSLLATHPATLPQGVPTRFGPTQHLTAEHADELRAVEKFTVPQPVAHRQNDAEPPTALIVVNLAYRDAGDRKRNLRTYPGSLLATPERTWLPDADLSDRLDRLGIAHDGGWKSPEECVRQLVPATIA